MRNNSSLTCESISFFGSRIVTIFSRMCGSKVFASVDLMGNTPLHSAIREETNVQSLRALIQAYPDALHMQTRYEDTPLHLACLRKVNCDVVREIAQASCVGLESALVGKNGKMCLSPLLFKNRAGQTPFGIAMEEYRNVFPNNQQGATTDPAECKVKVSHTPEQKRAFDVLAALVKILHYGPLSDDSRNDSLVAACVSLHRNDARLDPLFIHRALHLFPGEARISRDGNYPLHIEASIPVEKMFLLDAPVPDDTETSSSSNNNIRGCCGGACQQRAQVLHRLVEIYPVAARIRNSSGHFPLNLMIQNGRRWDNTFAQVVRSYPEALHWVENVSPSVVPNVLAKVNGCGPDTLFSLIRARPAILLEK